MIPLPARGRPTAWETLDSLGEGIITTDVSGRIDYVNQAGEQLIGVPAVDALGKSITLILIEHDMDVALRVAERVTMMHDGRKIVEGTPDEIRANQLVHELYLGGRVTDDGIEVSS